MAKAVTPSVDLKLPGSVHLHVQGSVAVEIADGAIKSTDGQRFEYSLKGSCLELKPAAGSSMTVSGGGFIVNSFRTGGGGGSISINGRSIRITSENRVYIDNVEYVPITRTSGVRADPSPTPEPKGVLKLKLGDICQKFRRITASGGATVTFSEADTLTRWCGLAASGGSRIHIEQDTLDQLRADASGGSSIEMGNVRIHDARIHTSGGARVTGFTITGEGDLGASGASTIVGAKVRGVHVHKSTTGVASINITEGR